MGPHLFKGTAIFVCAAIFLLLLPLVLLDARAIIVPITAIGVASLIRRGLRTGIGTGGPMRGSDADEWAGRGLFFLGLLAYIGLLLAMAGLA